MATMGEISGKEFRWRFHTSIYSITTAYKYFDQLMSPAMAISHINTDILADMMAIHTEIIAIQTTV